MTGVMHKTWFGNLYPFNIADSIIAHIYYSLKTSWPKAVGPSEERWTKEQQGLSLLCYFLQDGFGVGKNI